MVVVMVRAEAATAGVGAVDTGVVLATAVSAAAEAEATQEAAVTVTSEVDTAREEAAAVSEAVTMTTPSEAVATETACPPDSAAGKKAIINTKNRHHASSSSLSKFEIGSKVSDCYDLEDIWTTSSFIFRKSRSMHRFIFKKNTLLLEFYVSRVNVPERRLYNTELSHRDAM